jgi:hypothetical protein
MRGACAMPTSSAREKGAAWRNRLGQIVAMAVRLFVTNRDGSNVSHVNNGCLSLDLAIMARRAMVYRCVAYHALALGPK